LRWLRVILLFPFSLLYLLITGVRNILFNIDLLEQRTYPFPLISIGNLRVGGTGKTPTIESLIKLLQNEGYRCLVLSRGYGRKSKGLREVQVDDRVSDSGDEPLQIKRKFPDVRVLTDRNRRNALNYVNENLPDIDVVLMDDAFQHRYVKAGLNILLTAHQEPYPEDWIMPSGNLREPAASAKRADIILITKSYKTYSPIEADRITELIKPKSYQDVFFSFIQYSEPVNILSGESLSKDQLSKLNIVLFTGIASDAFLMNYLRRKSKKIIHLKFGDHHSFTEKNINTIILSLMKRYL
jgi:tetraacyldisaccharide 4'-kinase